ncbi:MAG: hypothetical protein H3C62_16800 [Gemmatimonadaceae bacterium]|nr:hypothetical protein [Gemmatimonadaceae bacterium]
MMPEACQFFEVWRGGRCIAHGSYHNAAEAIVSARRKFGGVVGEYIARPSTRDPLWRESQISVPGVRQFEADWLGVGLIVSRRRPAHAWSWSVQRLLAPHERPCELAVGSSADFAGARLHAARAAREVLLP